MTRKLDSSQRRTMARRSEWRKRERGCAPEDVCKQTPQDWVPCWENRDGAQAPLRNEPQGWGGIHRRLWGLCGSRSLLVPCLSTSRDASPLF